MPNSIDDILVSTLNTILKNDFPTLRCINLTTEEWDSTQIMRTGLFNKFRPFYRQTGVLFPSGK